MRLLCPGRPIPLAFAVAAAALPAPAQQFGQWSWDARTGLGGRSYANAVGGAATSSYGYQEGSLSLGLNGFIVHPAIAAFRLQLDAEITRPSEGAGRKSGRVGSRAELRLFPQGGFPVTLYGSRGSYSYGSEPSGGLLPLSVIPETVDSWGARFRLRRGWLRGLLGGVDTTSTAFVDLGERQGYSLAFLDWSGNGEALQHHYRAERRVNDWAVYGYRMDDLVLTADEHGWIAPHWRLDVSGAGLRRQTRSSAGPDSEAGSFRLGAAATQERAGGDMLSLRYAGGVAEGTSGASTATHDVEARYLWFAGRGWQLGPFAAFAVQRAPQASATVPRAGLGAVWSGAAGAIETMLNVAASYGRSAVTSEGATVTTPYSSLAAALSLRHGDYHRLAKELELSWTQDEVTSAGGAITELPDLGTGLVRPGTQDELRSRFTLRHGWDSSAVVAYAEWRRRTASQPAPAGQLTADSVTATAQATLRRAGATLTAGRTSIATASRQEVEYLAGSIDWRPAGWFSLHALHREERRVLALAPDVDGARSELVADVRLGLFRVRAQVFQSLERVSGGAERSNRGFMWTLERGFAGALPIVSAPQRRGVIR